MQPKIISTQTTTTTKGFGLSKDELIKIARGAVYAIIGALLAYLTPIVLKHDFGSSTPILYALWPILVNAVNKFIDNQQTTITAST